MTDTDVGATQGRPGLRGRVVSRRDLLRGATLAGVGTGLAVLAPGAFAAGASGFPIGAAAKSKSKPVTVTMWHSMTSANLTALTNLTDQFNASQTDVSVNLVAQTSYTDTLTAYTTALSGGLSRLPDLVQWESDLIQILIDSQSVVPVGSAVTADHYSLGDYVPSMVNFFRVDGTLWALPFNVSSQILYYDQNALAKAGHLRQCCRQVDLHVVERHAR
jgi:sn-glycerol 3-phosphate transport system substrate-binding protein